MCAGGDFGAVCKKGGEDFARVLLSQTAEEKIEWLTDSLEAIFVIILYDLI